MVSKQSEVLGFGQIPNRAPNSSNNDGDALHDYLQSGVPTVDSPDGSSQAQTQAVETDQKGFRGKLTRVVGKAKAFGRGSKTSEKKNQDLPSNSTPEPQESVHTISPTSQQTPCVDDPTTTLHAGQERTFHAFHNSRQSESQTHQGYGGDSSLPHSIPGTYTVGENISPTPHFPGQERYLHRFSDPRDIVNIQGELADNPAQVSSVMNRPRPLPPQQEAHELPATRARPNDALAAAVAVYPKRQPATQNERLYDAPPARVGGSSSTLSSGRAGTPMLPIQGVVKAPPHMQSSSKRRPVQQSTLPPLPDGDSAPAWSSNQQRRQQPGVNSPALDGSTRVPTSGIATSEATSSEPVRAPLEQGPLPLSPPPSVTSSSPPPPPLPPAPVPSTTPAPSLLSSIPPASQTSTSPPLQLLPAISTSEGTTTAPAATGLPGPEQNHTLSSTSPPQAQPAVLPPAPTPEAATLATGAPTFTESEKQVQQPPPPSFVPSPGTTDATESRINAYLAKHGVALDPVQDALGNLTTWSDKQQERFKRDLEAIQVQHQQALQQQTSYYEGKLQKLQQVAEQASTECQTAIDQVRKCNTEINQKDWKISQLESELAASRKYANDTEARRVQAEEEKQQVSARLGQAEAFIRQLQQDNTTLGQERDQKAQEIQQRLAKIQELNIVVAGHKADLKNRLEANTAEYERQLEAERRQTANLVAKHRQELAAKDRQAEAIAQQHREAMEERDQQWRSVVQKGQDELATKEMRHQADLEQRDHQLALRVAKHATDLKSKEEQLTRTEAHYKQRLFEVESSIQAEIDRTQKENRATITNLRKQIASYSKDSYVPIEDAHFIKVFQALVQDVNQLASQVRLPAIFDFDPALDPTSCLDRNVRRKNWIWPRFVRSICWRVLLGGFFSLPFGFGALGRQGEGSNELRRMYQATCAAVIAQGDDTTGLAVSMMPNDKDINLYRTLYMQKILSDIRSSSSSSSSSESTMTITNGTNGGEISSSSYAPLFRKNVEAVGRELYDTLHHIVNGQLNTSACYQHACAVAHKLGILALEMGTQRARVWLETCRYGEHVSDEGWKSEAEDMETLTTTASNGMGAVGMAVDLMVHPCLSRVGDGRAELEKKKVVVRGEYVPLPVSGTGIGGIHVNGR
ncbi:hypothetical protein V8F20_001003 [Naviculisporaceae sp. PSN 640]